MTKDFLMTARQWPASDGKARLTILFDTRTAPAILWGNAKLLESRGLRSMAHAAEAAAGF